MPKNNRVEKRDGIIKKHKVSATLRVGTRKAGTSALKMTTEALKTLLIGDSHKSDHANARTVLRMRGIAV